MGLNIKNQRVHDLARRAAELTGQSQTGVIETALEKLLTDLETSAPDRRSDQLQSLLAAIDADMTDETRATLRADDLYDDDGLPA